MVHPHDGDAPRFTLLHGHLLTLNPLPVQRTI